MLQSNKRGAKGRIFFPMHPTPLECLRTLRSYFRHSGAEAAYVVFHRDRLAHWTLTRCGAQNWGSRMLWDSYGEGWTIARVNRHLEVLP